METGCSRGLSTSSGFSSQPAPSPPSVPQRCCRQPLAPLCWCPVGSHHQDQLHHRGFAEGSVHGKEKIKIKAGCEQGVFINTGNSLHYLLSHTHSCTRQPSTFLQGRAQAMSP